MNQNHNELLDVLNSSGFPFQIGVRREIERTSAAHGWEIDAEEFYWRHPGSDAAGFIDLVSSHGEYIFTLLIECKRVKDEGKWLFVTPREYTGEKRRLSALCTNKKGPESKAFLGWGTFDFDPISPEAAYCVFRGQDEKNPMLERIADDPLSAVEGIGYEYMDILSDNRSLHSGWRLFLPLIVTNASLYTGTFAADSVGMANGRMAEGSCDFKPVPLIGFRKSLATHYPGDGSRSGHRSPLTYAGLMNERTILVANASTLAENLKLINIAGSEAAFGQKLFGLNP